MRSIPSHDRDTPPDVDLVGWARVILCCEPGLNARPLSVLLDLAWGHWGEHDQLHCPSKTNKSQQQRAKNALNIAKMQQ